MRVVPSLIRSTLLMAAFTTLPAFADSTVSAQLSNLQYTLTDLNTGDAIVPLQPAWNANLTFGAASVSDFSQDVSDEITFHGMQPQSDQVALGGHSAGWSVTPGLGGTVSGAVTTEGPGYANIFAMWNVPLTLAAHTSITVTAQMNLEWIDLAPAVDQGGSAMASLSIVSNDPRGYEWGWADQTESLTAAGSLDRELSVTFTNNGNIAMFLTMSGSVQSGANVISVVPEPQVYAMLGAGMLLIGIAARRRERRSAGAQHKLSSL